MWNTGCVWPAYAAAQHWNPQTLPEIEVKQGDHTESFRVLAGALMNFPLGALPFQPGLKVEDLALSLHLIPYHSRLQALSLVPRAKALAKEAKIFPDHRRYSGDPACG